MLFERVRGPNLQHRFEFFLKDFEELVLPGHVLTNRLNSQVEAPQDSRFKMWARMNELVEQIAEVLCTTMALIDKC